MHYYTYAYLREDKTPYYIGKGQGKRIYSKQKYIKPPKDKSRVIYLKQNLTEEQAFKHEIYMIDVFGRIDLGTGILHNRTDGGDGASGLIHSKESRRKISVATKGNTYCLGITRSEETRKRMSEAKKGNTNCLGRILSEEHRRKISDANKDKTFSEEHRRKIGVASKGTKWWNDGCGNRKRMIECPGDDWKPGIK
jgi:hypothetical protein